MATNLSILEFFTRIREEEDYEGPIIDKEAKLDLESYINNYTGHTRFDRLIHIARTSTHLCVDALRAAVAEAKGTRDVDDYILAQQYLRQAAPGDPAAVFDEAWVKDRKEHNDFIKKQLEESVLLAKDSRIQESIKLCQEELARFYESSGSRLAAIEVFGSIKPTMIISGTPIENVRNQMRIRLGRKEYQQALVTINKSTLATSDDRVTAGPLEALKGLCYLGLGRYGEATKHFLRSQMSPAAAAAASSQLENEARNGASSEAAEVLTQNDVAVYGGLLSLATKDRLALQTEVLDNQTFRPFMAIEPHIRRAITLFVGCRYAACLELLESYRTEYLLDMHLQPHVDVLLSRIRIKCMTQFCRPFKTVSLATLRDHFRTPASDLEEELAAMIGNGDLPHARLDVMSGYLENYPPDPRMASLEKSEQFQEMLNYALAERIRLMSLRLSGLDGASVAAAAAAAAGAGAGAGGASAADAPPPVAAAGSLESGASSQS